MLLHSQATEILEPKTNMPSLEQAKQYIYSLDFSKIIGKLISHGGWIKDDVERTCQLYRNFLYLNKKYCDHYQSLPPSEDIDEFWHSHILDTKAYAHDCQFIFGEYFHHYPYLGIDGKTDHVYVNNAFELTQKLHFEEFAEMIEPTRSRYPKAIYSFLKWLS